MRDRRAAGWVGGCAVVAGRRTVAGVRREADRAQLVPSAQREHRGRLPGAPGARRSRELTGALLHERCAGTRALRARPECGAAAGAGTVGCGRTRARRSAARDGWGIPLARARAPGPLSAHPRCRALHRGRASSGPDARLRRHRAAPAAPIRVVRRRAGRAARARARSGRQPDLRLALRGATGVALAADAVGSSRT
jgi:hypothetical protein